MIVVASSESVGLSLLSAALGLFASSFVWLLVQMAGSRRLGWLTTVALPLVLAGAGVCAAAVALPGRVAANGWLTLPGVGAGLLAGLLFDRASAVRRARGEVQGRRSPWPMLLWGAAMLLFATAPAWSAGARSALERGSAALALVSASSLAGQAAGWVWRLCRRRAPQDDGPNEADFSRRLGPRVGGAAAALASFCLLLAW
jgi:hypothetical protein